MSNHFDKHQTDGEDGGRRNNRKNRSGYLRKAKRVVLSRIRRSKKEPESNDNRPSSSGRCCCFCFKRIPNLGSSTGSPTSDPNCSEFNFDSLRGLIEKSDFLLDECNTHLDVLGSDDSFIE